MRANDTPLLTLPLRLWAGPVSASKSIVSGAALEAKHPGRHELIIDLRDKFGNPALWPSSGIRIVLRHVPTPEEAAKPGEPAPPAGDAQDDSQPRGRYRARGRGGQGGRPVVEVEMMNELIRSRIGPPVRMARRRSSVPSQIELPMGRAGSYTLTVLYEEGSVPILDGRQMYLSRREAW